MDRTSNPLSFDKIEIMSIIQTHFEKLLNRIEGVNGMALSDKEGVIIFKVYQTENYNQILESSALTSIFLIASEQASKLGLKKNRSMITFYDNYQLIQFNFSNFMVHILADPKANTGILMDLYSELEEMTKLMHTAITTPC